MSRRCTRKLSANLVSDLYTKSRRTHGSAHILNPEIEPTSVGNKDLRTAKGAADLSLSISNDHVTYCIDGPNLSTRPEVCQSTPTIRHVSTLSGID